MGKGTETFGEEEYQDVGNFIYPRILYLISISGSCAEPGGDRVPLHRGHRHHQRQAIGTKGQARTWKEFIFLEENRVLYTNSLSLIVHNRAINCPRNDLIFFFAYDLNYKIVKIYKSELQNVLLRMRDVQWCIGPPVYVQNIPDSFKIA